MLLLSMGIFSQLGDFETSVDLIEATSPALEGDVEEATENVIEVGTDYVVGVVYAALFSTILAPIIAFLKKL